MKLYKKKPVTIEAVQFDGTNQDKIHEFTDGKAVSIPMSKTLVPAMEIDTLEGVMRADEGDFIIKGLKGEFYPCKPDIFNLSYDEV